NWFEQVSKYADFLQCISQTVRLNVVQRLSQHASTTELAYRTGWFSLGCELKESRCSNTNISPQLLNLLSDNQEQSPWLMVGTLEPRKNHSFVIDSFEKLWREGYSEKLLLLGRVGWNCDVLIRRIRSHPEFGKRLYMSNHSNDSEVEYAYRKSKGIITSSWDEGYGLPIVEGLHYNGTVIASDIPVHREVGLNRVQYFPLKDPNSLVEILADSQVYEQAVRQARREIPGFALTTWADSYRSLITSIENLISNPQAPGMAA
ncbi:MAG: glycosyltransferase, partial [Planctomycetes bacterium]|nr:glycosyltransferase [Planctomycetota bacterium]